MMSVVYIQLCLFTVQEQCVLSPRQVESVEQMKEIMEDLVQGGIRATDDLKRTIVAHCDHCNDEDCKVPHRAAGW